MRGLAFIALLIWGLGGQAVPAAAAAVNLDAPDSNAATVALISSVWLAAAVFAIIRAARWRREAKAEARRSARLAGLLQASPDAYLIVRRDGHAIASDKLLIWLDREEPLRSTDDLGGEASPFDAEAVAGLMADIADLALAGNGFTRRMRTATGKWLLAHGVLADSEVAGDNGVVVWFTDVTEIESSRLSLIGEVDRLSTSLSTLSTLIEAAPFPIWHRKSDLKLALVNSAYVRAVEGVDALDVIVRGLELFDSGRGTSPRESAAIAQTQKQMVEHSEPTIVAGERRMFRVFDVPVGEAGVAGFAFDIDALEQARAELQRFTRAQRETLDRLSAGVAQFAPDQSLVFFNRPFARIFGLEPEWLGSGPEFDHVLERMREERRLPEQRDFPSWRNERRGWFTMVDGVEESWTLPGGTHLRVLAQPRPDGGLLLIFEDRTEQLRLASSRDTLIRVQAATLDNLFEAVGVFAANGRLQLWNRRFGEIWGMPQERLLTYPHVDELVTVAAGMMANPQRAELLKNFVRSATTDRRQRSARFAMRDGRHMECAAVPLPDGNALFTILDITDSRRIETALRERNEALQAADRIKSSFVANMSYELRTPLTSIVGFGEMLMGGLAGELLPQQADYIASMLEAATRLQGLIDDILDLTSSEVGSLELNLAEVDVSELVTSEVAQVREAALGRNLQLEVQVAASAGKVEADERRLRQAIHHLLQNALSYTPGGGRVAIDADGDDERVRVIVSDNGVGIAKEDQERLFDPFQQAQANVAPTAGLGLNLVQRFVTLHGGQVLLESEPGEGTIVTITLPRSQALR